VDILRRCDEHERQPVQFAAHWAEADRKALNRIARARKAIRQIEASEEVLADAASLCMAVAADGSRGELTLIRAARASAALAGRSSMKRKDLIAVAPLALRHRLRRNVLDETGSTARIELAIAELWP
jgi:magnesium chelatase subunit I